MENSETIKRVSKVRSKKLANRVDFSSMVSLGFLLVFFFMLTSFLSKPQSMYLGLPDGCGGGCGGGISCGVNRTLTVMLDDNDKIVYYMGYLGYPSLKPTETHYGKNGIRDVLLLHNMEIRKNNSTSKKGLIVIIKPSKSSNYKNLVDILDEINIVNIQTYAIIDDFIPEEIELLKGN